MDESIHPTVVPPRHRLREALIAILLVLCVVLVGFWEFMSNRSQRPFSPFALTAQSFTNFTPRVSGWTLSRLTVPDDPVEPHILALLATREGAAAPIFIRLVHGYNMVDCMRIKGERVDLLADTRSAIASADGVALDPISARTKAGALPPGFQVWRLTSPADRVNVAATAMLRAGDFSRTAVDTRDMLFPRVDVPDNPGWFPQGLTWRSLRHPLRNGRLFLRAKWNASRTDVLTFLGLRQPAWASEELLTLVAASTDTTVPREREAAVTADIVAAHTGVLLELQAWAKARETP